MSFRPFLLTALAGLLLGGCATLEDKRASLQLPAAQSQTNYFGRGKAVVFETLVQVLEKMDYTIAEALPAQGVIEAYGRVLEGDRPGDSSQFLISARVRNVGDAETSVELTVREAYEGNFRAGATRQSFARHGRYDSIYEALESALGEDSWRPPSQPAAASRD